LGSDNTVKRTRISDGATTVEHELGPTFSSIDQSPRQPYLSVVEKKDGKAQLRFLGMDSLKEIRSVPVGGDDVIYAGISPDEEFITVYKKDDSFEWIDAEAGKSVATVSFAEPGMIDGRGSHDRRTVAILGKDQRVRVYRYPGSEPIATITTDEGKLISLAVNHDGSRLVAQVEGKGLRVYEIPSGRLAASVRSSHSRGMYLGFSDDGELLMVKSGYSNISVFRTSDMKQIWARSDEDWAGNVISAFSRDENRLYLGGNDGLLRVFDSRTGEESLAYRVDGSAIGRLELSDSGDRLALCTSKGTVVVVATDDWRIVGKLDAEEGEVVDGMAFLGERGPLAVVYRSTTDSNTGRLALWDADAGRVLSERECGIVSWTTTPDYRLIVLDSAGTILIHAAGGIDERIGYSTTESRAARSIRAVSGGERLVLLGKSGLSLIDLATGQLLKTATAADWGLDDSDPIGLVTDRSGERLVVATSTSDALLLNVGDLKLLEQIPLGTQYQWLDMSLTGNLVLAVGTQGNLYQLARNLERDCSRTFPYGAGLKGLALSADERTLAVAGTEGVDLWDWRNDLWIERVEIGAAAYRVFFGQSDEVVYLFGRNTACRYEHAKKQLECEKFAEVVDQFQLRSSVVGNEQGWILLQSKTEPKLSIRSDLDGEEIATLEFDDKISRVTTSGDHSRVVVSLHDKSVRYFDTSTWKEIGRLTGLNNYWGDLDFSPDGKTAVLAETGPDIYLVDLETGERFETIFASEKMAYGPRFTPDGKHFLVYDLDSWSLKMWQTAKPHDPAISIPAVGTKYVIDKTGEFLFYHGRDEAVHAMPLDLSGLREAEKLDVDAEVARAGFRIEGFALERNVCEPFLVPVTDLTSPVTPGRQR
jgi:WD40 repeat protein